MTVFNTGETVVVGDEVLMFMKFIVERSKSHE